MAACEPEMEASKVGNHQPMFVINLAVFPESMLDSCTSPPLPPSSC